MPLERLEVPRRSETRRNPVLRDGRVVDPVGAVEKRDTRVLDPEGFICALRTECRQSIDLEVNSVGGSGDAQVRYRRQPGSALIHDEPRIAHIGTLLVHLPMLDLEPACVRIVERRRGDSRGYFAGGLGYAYQQNDFLLVTRDTRIERSNHFEVRPRRQNHCRSYNWIVRRPCGGYAHTRQSRTASASEVRGSRVGTNSCATYPVNPVSAMARMIAG